MRKQKQVLEYLRRLQMQHESVESDEEFNKILHMINTLEWVLSK